jgi:inorganic pyrophosphatase
MSDPRLQTLFSMLFQAHPWHGVPFATDSADLRRAFIEIVTGDTIKYEVDKPSGLLRVDRPQKFSNVCPALYGFFPQTYCGPRVAARCSERTGVAHVQGDGDPLDVCVLSEKPFSQGGFIASVRLIGGLRMIDNGEVDDKIIAVLPGDAVYGHVQDLAELGKTVVDRLEHYFLTYKLEPHSEKPKTVQIAEIYGREESEVVLQACAADYQEKFGDPAERMTEFLALVSKR